MGSELDLSQFFDTFFDEADELLEQMEQSLLALDVAQPEQDQLQAIFRAAHSIKGGASTFGCFQPLAQTTHLLENLLDAIRRGDAALRQDMIDVFLQAKDVLAGQVAAYRAAQEPDADACAHVCAQLRALTEESQDAAGAAPETRDAAAPAQATTEAGNTGEDKRGEDHAPLCVTLTRINDQDARSLLAEMALLGEILHADRAADTQTIWLRTTVSADDVCAVCCFVVDAAQITITRAHPPVVAAPVQMPIVATAASDTAASDTAASDTATVATAPDSPALDAQGSPALDPSAAVAKPAAAKPAAARGGAKDGGTMRVGVEKVDQVINLVGELVITQAMLNQTVSVLDPVQYDRLIHGIEQLERNARDLQEAVMAMRMMPMEYVFSRFPRLVREHAGKMGKRIRLVTQGQATELDKSLIERMVDPLTHLVRNGLDHGIESPEARVAAGKDAEGQLTLSAQHSGGQIVIEVSDDGAGLSRAKILKKALSLGFPVSEHTPDEELWQLIFAPGFSTATEVTDISGRGVGMDVVRRNIQSMGGHVQLDSRAGQGTTTRIVLPLTLAILDGISVRVGQEIFVLPLTHVTESLQTAQNQMHHLSEQETVLSVRGEYLPVYALHQIFNVPGAQTDASKMVAVIVQAEEKRFALLVDQLIGQHQVVVKNLETNYRRVPGISAATILGDGRVALIVDMFALMRVARAAM